jgi:hypothetical protein
MRFGEDTYPIGRFLLDRTRALGLSRRELVSRLGYRQMGKGHKALTAASDVVPSGGNRPACIEVNLRRGFVRLGIGLAVLWFVFWTCAYVMRPLASEDAQPLPALSPTTDIALIAVVIVGLPWIV